MSVEAQSISFSQSTEQLWLISAPLNHAHLPGYAHHLSTYKLLACGRPGGSGKHSSESLTHALMKHEVTTTLTSGHPVLARSRAFPFMNSSHISMFRPESLKGCRNGQGFSVSFRRRTWVGLEVPIGH